MSRKLTPICPYCKGFSEEVTGDVIYPHRDDLAHLKFYQCAPCDAYVGTHRHSGKPLGSLANAELREWRKKAHAAFDPMWQSGTTLSRKEAYLALAVALQITVDECHIAHFDVEQCQQTIACCKGDPL